MPIPIRRIGLTQYLHSPSVRTAWKAFFPHTSRFLSFINNGYKKSPIVVSPCTWVNENRSYGSVGTAYDYFIGTVWMRQSLHSPLQRAKYAILPHAVLASEEAKKEWHIEKAKWTRSKKCRVNYLELLLHLIDRGIIKKYSRQLPDRLSVLKEYLIEQLAIMRADCNGNVPLDFIRGLVALAELDALFRSIFAPLPAWIESPKIIDTPGLVSMLRGMYPDDVVCELQALYNVTKEDLLYTDNAIYNPCFGWEGVAVCGDGDLLLGDLLIDFKVSVTRFKSEHLWQLFGYAALDHLQGKNRIKKIGLYNPRFRILWSAPIEDVIRGMGGTNFDDFCIWFKRKASTRSVGLAIRRDREALNAP